MNSIYLTTTLPYVNSEPHLGFALEVAQADAIKRYFEELEERGVFLNTGTDEHGLKIYRKAAETGQDPQDFVDSKAASWQELLSRMYVYPSRFIRTTESEHKRSAQDFWQRCMENGDIYKASYKIKYCVGCELEKTDSELEDGKCPIHPNLELETIDEENYFFRFSKYKEDLIRLYEDNPEFVIPRERLNEIKNFIKEGPKDFSISRLREKMPWGVEVPGDSDHVMYVWFDALVNYLSSVGWPEDIESFNYWWPPIQFAGKDNLRQQSAMFQAMLFSAGIKPSSKIVLHGYVTGGGFKMSKSLGNVVHPFEVIEEYSADVLRHYLLRHMPTFEDGDFTWERLKDVYNADLANGVGNLVSRILKMAGKYGVELPKEDMAEVKSVLSRHSYFSDLMHDFEISKAVDYVWQKIGEMDHYIEETQPFKTIKTDEEKAKEDVRKLLSDLWQVSILLSPFMPDTARRISTTLKQGGGQMMLFQRKE